MLTQCLHQQPHSSTKLLPEEANCKFFLGIFINFQMIPNFGNPLFVRSKFSFIQHFVLRDGTMQAEYLWKLISHVSTCVRRMWKCQYFTREFYVERDNLMRGCVENVDFMWNFKKNVFSRPYREKRVTFSVFLMNLLNHPSGSTQNVFSHPAFISVHRCMDTTPLWGCQVS